MKARDEISAETGVELGYVLRRASWNNGFMTEAVRAVTEWVLSLDTVYRVSAYADIDNPGSQRVLAKAGMVNDGVPHRFTPHVNASVKPRDTVMYARRR